MKRERPWEWRRFRMQWWALTALVYALTVPAVLVKVLGVLCEALVDLFESLAHAREKYSLPSLRSHWRGYCALRDEAQLLRESRKLGLVGADAWSLPDCACGCEARAVVHGRAMCVSCATPLVWREGKSA